MSFVPPQFNKFGKCANDLFKKGFDFRNEVTTKNSNGKGLTTEMKVTAKGNDLTSSIKGNYKKNNYDGEVSLNTAGDIAFKGVVPYKVHENLKLTLSGSLKPCGTIEAEFAQPSVAGSASANLHKGNTNLKAAVSFGDDGLSVGGSGAAVVSKDGAFTVKDYNIGINYAESDYSTSLVTKNMGTSVAVAFAQKIDSTQSFAALYDYDMDKDSSAISLVNSMALDQNTNLKLKFNTSGQLATALTHVVANPHVKVNVAAEFDAKNFSFNANKFGLGLSFGDF